MPRLSPAHQALLRSGSGPAAAAWLMALPSTPVTTLRPALFQVALRRRLRLPLLLGARRCPGRRCGCVLDREGDHLAACSRTGLLQQRAKPLERAWTQVLREAGARTVPQPLLRDLDLALQAADDGRRLDVVAYGLPLFGGVPICGDATLVSPLHGSGLPWRGADTADGLRIRAARRRKEMVYPELLHNAMAKLVVLAHEVGGRWAPEALQLVGRLAKVRCQQSPKLLRHSAQGAWRRRWVNSLSMATQSALAASLAEPAALLTASPAAPAPEASEVLCEERMPPAGSRLPLR